MLLQVLHEREPELHDHHHEVAELAVAVGNRLAMLPDEIDVMVRAAELHDVGKMAVPDKILDKPGPLDPPEREFIERHTLVGERILSAAPALQPVARLVRTSHERWDGTGYPDGLAGEQIPLGARVIAVCDAFHAMTSERVYQPPVAAVGRARRAAPLRRHPASTRASSPCSARSSRRDGCRSPRIESPGPPIEIEPLPTALRDPSVDRLV